MWSSAWETEYWDCPCVQLAVRRVHVAETESNVMFDVYMDKFGNTNLKAATHIAFEC